jgi:hypothetical protein
VRTAAKGTVVLEQDDSDATVNYCNKKGDKGWWLRSIMLLYPEHMP